MTFYFCIPVPYNEKDIFFCDLVLEGLVGLHRTIQLQLLHYLQHIETETRETDDGWIDIEHRKIDDS